MSFDYLKEVSASGAGKPASSAPGSISIPRNWFSVAGICLILIGWILATAVVAYAVTEAMAVGLPVNRVLPGLRESRALEGRPELQDQQGSMVRRTRLLHGDSQRCGRSICSLTEIPDARLPPPTRRFKHA